MRARWAGQLIGVCLLLISIQQMVTTVRAAEGIQTVWLNGSGSWTNEANWSSGVPTARQTAVVRGQSSVAISEGHHEVGRLDIGTHAGDRCSIEQNGGQLLVRQDSLIIGESTGGEGTFTLNDGAMHCVMDVFVGGATGSTGRMNRSALLIRGGSFLGLTLTVGEGLGCESLVAIDGSRADSIHALEFVYFMAAADPSGKPGESTLSFTLDEHGVTPITIQSRWDGLRILHDQKSHCRLKIGLRAIPPREDIPLVISRTPIRGMFDDLPEGSEISADFQGHRYRWNLTYHGGESHDDLVLQNRSEYAADVPVTHVRPVPQTPTPLWKDHPLYPLSIAAGEPAFEGAEGYGAYTPGGRGGSIITVDNLNDSGPGSLRAALTAQAPRIVKFRVAGVIPLQSVTVIDNPFITLDGSDAPSPGITLRRHGIEVHTHDVVLRHFRIRIGDDDVRLNDANIRYAAGDGEYALYFTNGSHNCIADHLSLSWSTNKILSTTKMSDLITIQWCILSESLNLEGHGYASIVGGNRVTWHHNLFAHNNSRNPRFQGAVDADFRNNVIYDWGEKTAYGEFDRLNYVGNYLKPGPSTAQRPRLFHDGREVVMPGSLFMEGNMLEGDAAATRDNWRGTAFYYDRATLAAVAAFDAPAVNTEPATMAYEHVLEQSGALLPMRDAVDQRVVSEVRMGKGQIIQSVKQAGGWPASPTTSTSDSNPTAK